MIRLFQYLFILFIVMIEDCQNTRADINYCECGIPILKSNVTCTSDSPKISRIYGGNSARIINWPWQVIVTSSSDDCGGSIISDRHILTAAHCLYKKRYIRVYAGIGNRKEEATSDLEVEAFYTHRHYNVNTIQNDIAVIKLKTPLNFTKKIKPVCLPSQDDSLPAENTSTYLTGYGQKQNYWMNKKLNEVCLPIRKLSHCNLSYTNKDASLFIAKHQFCAGYYHRSIDACVGDSGGPLVYQDTNSMKYIQIGITSWALDCGGGLPGVYTKVSRYIKWIQNVIKGNVPANREESSGPIWF